VKTHAAPTKLLSLGAPTMVVLPPALPSGRATPVPTSLGPFRVNCARADCAGQSSAARSRAGGKSRGAFLAAERERATEVCERLHGHRPS